MSPDRTDAGGHGSSGVAETSRHASSTDDCATLAAVGLGRLLACAIARELRDEDVVAFGLHAEVGLAAALLAQRLYAPNLIIRHGLRHERGVDLGPAAWTGVRDSQAWRQVEYWESHDAILDVAASAGPRQFCNVFFIGGLQIDRHGNTNLIGLRGPDGRPGMRGPGSIGTTSIATFAARPFLFAPRHTPQVFVEQVDYVSVAGWDRRAAFGLERGPELCFSALGVFDFRGGCMAVRSLHPGVTRDEVIRRTGFRLDLAEPVPETPPPTPAEWAALQEIDSRGLLARFGEPDRR